MDSLYLLIPLSLVFLAFAIGVFIWAVNTGQYEDLEGEGERILFDEEEEPHTEANAGEDDGLGEND